PGFMISLTFISSSGATRCRDSAHPCDAHCHAKVGEHRRPADALDPTKHGARHERLARGTPRALWRAMFLRSGIRLGTLFGIQIMLDWSLILIFTLLTFSLGAGAFPAWHP